ncbi:cell wall-binding protein [Desulfitobacterium dichloroeliminans LMG P-21439]|uniref:Cell wall-binding protein n=2 Tax=Desulfitobacterium dichloroeliminans TaxID=233055 RepID=L0F6W8_DESDL|nr:cell wall-binding protein [Desulfitobacterium dichloroeliminans LMG P-21439]
MKKKGFYKLTVMFMSILLLVGMTPVSVIGENSELIPEARGEIYTLLSTDSDEAKVIGLGTKENPLQIETAEQLAFFAWSWNNGTLPTSIPENPHLLQVNNIDLSAYGKDYEEGKGWLPIGKQSRPFKGTFEGNNKTIKGLYIDRSEEMDIGLFGRVESCTLQNIIVEGAVINGSFFVGCVVGHVVWLSGNSTVDNCVSSGIVSGNEEVGGIVGYTEPGSTIQNCASSSAVSGKVKVGGIIGDALWSGEIKNCVSSGIVSGNDQVGGIAGYVNNLQDCVSSSVVSGRSRVGGIAGFVEFGGLQNSISSGAVSGTEQVGGIAGLAQIASIQNSVSSGTVKGTNQVGGIVGKLKYGTIQKIQDCAALNSYIMGDSNLGRIVGELDGDPSYPILVNNYAYREMKVGNSTVEGVDPNTIDGASVGIEEIKKLWTDGVLKASWNAAGVWDLAESKLPVLKNIPNQSDLLPTHLVGFAGSGTIDQPFLIYSADDLKDMADKVNHDMDDYSGISFRLENNIELSAYGKDYDNGKGWTPIGSSENPFKGYFDGNDKTITGLYINNSDEDYVGLFGYIVDGTVQNVALDGGSVSGNNNVGGVIGYLETALISKNLINSGSVSGSNNVGGIVGFNKGPVEKCVNKGSISAIGRVGGVVGFNEGGVEQCINTGSISAKIQAGGVVGYSKTGVGKSINTGSISAEDQVGGVVGYTANVVYESINTGNLRGRDQVGGIVGKTEGSSIILHSVALNSIITGDTDSGRIVGFRGNPGVDLENNCAYKGMKLNQNTVSDGAGDDKNGVSVGVEEIKSLWTGTEGLLKDLYDISAWTLAEGKLPTLIDMPYQSDLLPAYIVGLAGIGTSEEPYLIYSAADLKDMADRVNSDMDNDYAHSYFRLEKDIDLSTYGQGYDNGKGWTPIGSFDHPFGGFFDGNGKTIKGLYINNSDKDYVGLFGYIDNGTVQKVALDGGSVSGNSYVGGMVGFNLAGILQSCISAGITSGSGLNIGGMVGHMENGRVENCISSGNISGTNTNVGGVVGYVKSGTVEGCISLGNISGTNTHAGGVVGFSQSGTVKNCAALNLFIEGSLSWGRVTSEAKDTLSSNYAYSGMKVNGNTVSGTDNNLNGADKNIATLLRGSFWRETIELDETVWSIGDNSLPYLKALPEYVPRMSSNAYNLPAPDSGDIILSAAPDVMVKSAEVQTVIFRATGAFQNTTWPELTWDTNVGNLDIDADTFGSVLTVPEDFTGTITVTATLKSLPYLPGKSIAVQVNGDLVGRVTAAGTCRIGQTLTVAILELSENPGALAYQWMRGDVPISGATNESYEIIEGDLGDILSVCITAKHYLDKIQSEGKTVLRRENSTTPIAPRLVSKTHTKITLATVSGYEYAILPANGDTALLALEGAFQANPVFEGLSSGTSYDLYQRIVQTDIIEASDFSEKLVVTTNPIYSGGDEGSSVGAGGSSDNTLPPSNKYVPEINNVIDSDTVVVTLLEDTSLFSTTQIDRLIEQNQSKPVILRGNGYTFTFPAGSMLGERGNREYDLGLSLNQGTNHDAIRTLAGENFILSVNFNHSGNLPGEAEIRILVGPQYQGERMEYHYYNPQSGSLEYRQTVTVDQDGYATVTQSRCSQYVFIKQKVGEVPVRVYGENRYETALEIAKAYFPQGADTVIIARGDLSVDALPAVPLAKKHNAPLLLTPPDHLPENLLTVLRDLGAKQIIIIGGHGAVQTTLEEILKEAGYKVERVYGASRYDTAYEIAKRLEGTSGRAVLVNGDKAEETFADALSVSSWAGYHGIPILYLDSTLRGLPEATNKALKELKITETIIIGGEGVLPKELEGYLPNPMRYGGDTRYETNALVLKNLQPTTDSIYGVTGKDFADALTGAAVAAQSNSWLLLTGGTTNGLTPEQETLLQGMKGRITHLHIFGGSSVVSEGTIDRMKQLLNP